MKHRQPQQPLQIGSSRKVRATKYSILAHRRGKNKISWGPLTGPTVPQVPRHSPRIVTRVVGRTKVKIWQQSSPRHATKTQPLRYHPSILKQSLLRPSLLESRPDNNRTTVLGAVNSRSRPRAQRVRWTLRAPRRKRYH